MRRYFKMTDKAQRSLWCKLSNNSIFIPTQFLVEGDSKYGYEVLYVNETYEGFTLISLRSFYAVNLLIEQINTTGTTDFKKHCSTGSFAWSHVEIPLQLSGAMIDIYKPHTLD